MNKGSIQILIIFLAAFVFVGVKSISAKASVKNDIKSAISDRLSEENIVKKVYCYDYDNNGRKEAFVITGNRDSSGMDGVNDLWFAYKEKGKIKASVIKNYVPDACKVLKLKKVKLFCAAEYCTTSLPMDVYCVKGNSAEYIFQGDMLQKYKGNQFTSVHSTYDSSFENGIGGIGHTWKPYWFYYKNGKIYQYKAKTMSIKKFKKKYKNAEKVIKQYRKQGDIISVLHRENGLLHINYENKGNYTNVTFKIKGKKLINPAIDSGTYLTEMPAFEY